MGLLVECEVLRLHPHQDSHHQDNQNEHANAHPQGYELVRRIETTPDQRSSEKALDDQEREDEETERRSHRLHELSAGSLAFGLAHCFSRYPSIPAIAKQPSLADREV